MQLRPPPQPERLAGSSPWLLKLGMSFVSFRSIILALLTAGFPARAHLPSDSYYPVIDYYAFQTSWPNQETWKGWEYVCHGANRIFRVQLVQPAPRARTPRFVFEETILPENDSENANGLSRRSFIYEVDGHFQTTSLEQSLEIMPEFRQHTPWTNSAFKASRVASASGEKQERVTTEWRRATAWDFQSRMPKPATEALEEFTLRQMDVIQLDIRWRLCGDLQSLCEKRKAGLDSALEKRRLAWLKVAASITQ